MNDLSCWETKFKYCCYSKRLLSKLLLLNKIAKQKINILEVKKAIYYAKKYHDDQKRQSGEPYYSHPLEVAYRIADYIFETNILVTSILHDTIEDTNLTKNMIEIIFCSAIANQVEDLTRIKKANKISSAEMVMLLFSQKKNNSLLVKLFDRLHNMQTITAKSPEKIKAVTEETIETFIMLSLYLEKMPIEVELKKLCLRAIFNKNYDLNNENSLFNGTFRLPFLSLQNERSLN